MFGYLPHCRPNPGTSSEPDLPFRTLITTLFAGLLASASALASADPTPIDDTDDQARELSATLAFHRYLKAIDDWHVEDAADLALDPGDEELRLELVDRLVAFMRGRIKTPVRNEAVVVRLSGDWAMVVYQYDITVAGEPLRVITTAWMVQWEGCWRQFIVAPSDEAFWDTRRSDYEKLKQWFDEHAKGLRKPAA